MGWKMSRISSSLMGLLREPDQSAGSLKQVEHIRREVLDCLASVLDPRVARPALWEKVQFADDVQALWYLRSDVMHMLSSYCGEAMANAKLDMLTELFRGHLPKAQFASARRRG
jgi:hypothetical protein